MTAILAKNRESGKARRERYPRRHFTIVEFLVLLGILALLILFLLPLRRGVGDASRRSQCVNNFKQIGLALYNYEAEYKVLPPAYTVDPQGRPLHSWRTLLLPYMEQGSLYRTIDLTKPWDDPANAAAREASVLAFHCPSSSRPPNLTTYMAVVAPGGCFLPTEPRRMADVTDDPGSTIMVIEADGEDAVPWMAPIDINKFLLMGDGPAAKHSHPGGMNVACVDGSVHFLKAITPAAIRRALLSIAGHDDPPKDAW